MVDANRRGDWCGLDDQVHDLFFPCGDFGGNVADSRAAVFFERVVLGWGGGGAGDLSAELCVAGAAWICLGAFFAAYPCAGCGGGTGEWVLARSVHHLRESVCCAA